MAGKDLDYRLEVARIYSFRTWKVENVEPLDLAAAGFYYVGIEDRVKCFSCNMTFSKWTPSDNAWQDHSQYSRSCE